MDDKKPVVLVTGVSGRIGTSVARLFSKEFQVVGFDIIPLKNPIPGVDVFITDLSNLEKLKASLAEVRKKYGNKIVSIIHLAAYYNFAGGHWDKYQQITINGTYNLLTAAQEFHPEQFIFSSTMLVYAPCKVGEKLNEESLVQPKWEYPLSKVKTEELMHKNRGNTSIVILRISGIYDDDCHSIPISQQIDRIYEKKLESHLFPGNLSHGASFLHMEDLVRAIQLIVEKRNVLPPEEIFILGEPKVMSYGELQKEIGRLIYGKGWITLPIPKWMAKVGATVQNKIPFMKKSFIQPWMIDIADDHYDVDITKAKKVLGWQPAYSLKKCLPKMIESLKKEPKKWFEQQGL